MTWTNCLFLSPNIPKYPEKSPLSDEALERESESLPLCRARERVSLAAFERELNKWMQHEFNQCRLLFEEQQQEAYQCALTFLPALHQPQEEHQQQDHPLVQQQPPEEDIEMICRQ
jgi:hypothetical protein